VRLTGAGVHPVNRVATVKASHVPVVLTRRMQTKNIWFVARRSIQLSYGHTVDKYHDRVVPGIQRPREPKWMVIGKLRNRAVARDWE
jgi:hypothetical protein